MYHAITYLHEQKSNIYPATQVSMVRNTNLGKILSLLADHVPSQLEMLQACSSSEVRQ